MPNENDVTVEKISLDFSDDLGDNDFGIKDTQVLASKDLQNFLLSDPDNIKDLAEEKAKEDAAKLSQQESLKKSEEQRQKQQESPEEKIAREANEKKAADNKSDGKTFLENALFDNEQNQNSDEHNQTKVDLTSQKSDNAEDDDTYKTLGKDLLRLGVFSKSSEDETEETIDIKSGEDFLERFNVEKKKGAIGILDNFLNQFGEEYRDMFDAVFVNGVKPNEYLNSFAKIESIKELDLTQESNQERIVRAYYKGLKWDDTKVESKITKLKDYGDLEDEAKTYHQVLLDKEQETTTALETAKLEENQKVKDKELATNKSYQRILTEKLKTQEIDGVPLTQDDATKVFDYITSKKYKLQSGELLSEFDKDLMELNRPENHEMKIKLGLLLRKKLDLTSVKKQTISKKSDALFTLSTKNAKQKDSKERETKSFF